MSSGGACAKRTDSSLGGRRGDRPYSFGVVFYSRKNFLYPFDYHRGCNLFHAGVTKRALAQATVIAWRTWQVHAHDRFWSLVRADVNRVGRAENTDHRFVERRGNMHRARIIGHTDFATST